MGILKKSAEVAASAAMTAMAPAVVVTQMAVGDDIDTDAFERTAKGLVGDVFSDVVDSTKDD